MSPNDVLNRAGRGMPDPRPASLTRWWVRDSEREANVKGAKYMSVQPLAPCPTCGVAAGEKHQDGCDVETCAYCGGQRITCGACIGHPRARRARLPWTGEWPGRAECREFGWYAKPIPNGWESCQPEEPFALED